MSRIVPLVVRLVTNRADRHVTRGLRSLRFRSVVPGGFASCTFSLDRPLALAPDEIAYYGRVIIYDGRNGSTVWEGRLEDPGRGVGDDGQVWELAAVGPSAHAYDRTVPLLYVDHGLQGWVTASTTARYIDRSDLDFGVVQLSLTRGVVWVANDEGILRYDRLMACDQLIGRVSASWDAGTTSVSMEVRLGTAVGAGATTIADSDTWNTAGGSVAASRGGSPGITSGHDTPSLRIIRLTSNLTVADDAVWATLQDLVVRALLKDKTGADILSGYSVDTVLASEVVADLLGRVLLSYDGANASIATNSFAIDQLTYPDGITAGDVFDDLIRFEPDHYWAAWESDAVGDPYLNPVKYRFEWRAWPTAVRYDADVKDGFDSPGSADGLYNAVRVRYTTAAGLPATVRRTQSVSELSLAGLTREAYIDLGSEVGSLSNANRVGDQFLVEHQHPPNAGTLTIARPIRDLVNGATLMPWEIRPGNLVRVAGVLPRTDALNASTRDGVTIFRIVAVDYDTDMAAATLELDVAPVSIASAVANLQRQRVRRR